MAEGRVRLRTFGDRRIGNFLRMRRKERSIPAARLVAGRDGRPHASQRVDSRGDDGCGGRLPRRAVLSGLCAGGFNRHRLHRCDHALYRRDDRVVATDIKRVLAYSTVSQLGYMMFALGIGGWVAGILHLFTHAFFKALLFLCSGSVIHATGTNEMPKMGGLLKKMPFTAYTMLVGCLAIAGAGIPLVLGLSGYYSKDAIIAQGLVFKATNPIFGPLFYVAVGGAGMTAFYMFRLWFMTFLGKPRDEEIHHHAHESPWTMVGPLVVLAAFSIFIAWTVPFSNNWKFESLLRQAYPVGTECGQMGQLWSSASIPDPGLTHSNEVHISASLIAFTIALVGFVLAVAFYGVRSLDPDDARRTFSPFYRMFKNKWWFDELYNEMLVRPVHVVSGWISNVDKKGIDWCADNLARLFALGARLDDWFDRNVVDRLIDATAKVTYVIGIRLRTLQTGNVRQYVMFLTVGTSPCSPWSVFI